MFCGKAFSGVTRQLFYDANSKRGGVLMHAKVSGSHDRRASMSDATSRFLYQFSSLDLTGLV